MCYTAPDKLLVSTLSVSLEPLMKARHAIETMEEEGLLDRAARPLARAIKDQAERLLEDFCRPTTRPKRQAAAAAVVVTLIAFGAGVLTGLQLAGNGGSQQTADIANTAARSLADVDQAIKALAEIQDVIEERVDTNTVLTTLAHLVTSIRLDLELLLASRAEDGHQKSIRSTIVADLLKSHAERWTRERPDLEAFTTFELLEAVRASASLNVSIITTGKDCKSVKIRATMISPLPTANCMTLEDSADGGVLTLRGYDLLNPRLPELACLTTRAEAPPILGGALQILAARIFLHECGKPLELIILAGDRVTVKKTVARLFQHCECGAGSAWWVNEEKRRIFSAAETKLRQTWREKYSIITSNTTASTDLTCLVEVFRDARPEFGFPDILGISPGKSILDIGSNDRTFTVPEPVKLGFQKAGGKRRLGTRAGNKRKKPKKMARMMNTEKRLDQAKEDLSNAFSKLLGDQEGFITIAEEIEAGQGEKNHWWSWMMPHIGGGAGGLVVLLLIAGCLVWNRQKLCHSEVAKEHGPQQSNSQIPNFCLLPTDWLAKPEGKTPDNQTQEASPPPADRLPSPPAVWLTEPAGKSPDNQNRDFSPPLPDWLPKTTIPLDISIRLWQEQQQQQHELSSSRREVEATNQGSSPQDEQPNPNNNRISIMTPTDTTEPALKPTPQAPRGSPTNHHYDKPDTGTLRPTSNWASMAELQKHAAVLECLALFALNYPDPLTSLSDQVRDEEDETSIPGIEAAEDEGSGRETNDPALNLRPGLRMAVGEDALPQVEERGGLPSTHTAEPRADPVTGTLAQADWAPEVDGADEPVPDAEAEEEGDPLQVPLVEAEEEEDPLQTPLYANL